MAADVTRSCHYQNSDPVRYVCWSTDEVDLQQIPVTVTVVFLVMH